MFETAELGRAVSRAEFARQEPELQDRLAELERRLRWYEERFAGRPSPPLWFEKQSQ